MAARLPAKAEDRKKIGEDQDNSRWMAQKPEIQNA
jgi:hypothetical protein